MKNLEFWYAEVLNHFTNEWIHADKTVANIMFWFSFDEMLITELIFNAER